MINIMSRVYMYCLGLFKTCRKTYKNWKYQRDMRFMRHKNLTFTKAQAIMDFQDYTIVNLKN